MMCRRSTLRSRTPPAAGMSARRSAARSTPGSLLGTNWQLQTMRDSKLITATFAGTDHALFLHAGRSGAVVIDVDDESKLPGVAVRAERECRPPTQQTRPGRRHLIFVQPTGPRHRQQPRQARRRLG